MSSTNKTVKKISSAVIQAALTVILLTIAVMVANIAVRKAYRFGHEVFNMSPMAKAPGVDKLFVVDEDATTMQCLESLERAGLIRDKNVARFLEFFFEYEIYPGTYTLNTSMTVKEILAELNEKPPEETEKETTAAAQPATAAEPGSAAETKEIIEGGD